VRGALLRRTVRLSENPSLSFVVGADAGSAWHLAVFVNNDRVHDQLIEGGALTREKMAERHWEHVLLDLSAYQQQSVVIRLYDLVLVPHRYASNSYWRHLVLR